MPDYVCPRCKEELKSRVCEGCDLDLDMLFKDTRFEPPALHEHLMAAGAFYDTGTKSIVIPRAEDVPPVEAAFVRQGADLNPLYWWFVTECQLPSRRFTTRYVQAYLSQYGAGHMALPKVEYYGDRPQLFLDEDRLFWPNPSSAATRRVPCARFFYSGPELTPKRTGASEEFLASTKCANQEAQDALKGWMMGALLQSFLPPGGVPLLFLAANDNGSGKTTMATLLGSLFGGSILLPLAGLNDFNGLIRQSMDPSCRTLIFDNLTPPLGQQIIHSPEIAAVLTQRQISVKTLFATRGATKIPNRVLYIATANKPILSCELLTRSVAVSMDCERPSSEDWEAKWLGRRNELLEDLMAEALENWPKGPLPEYTSVPPNYRFCDWYKAVARALQKEPTLYPSQMTIVPPLDFVIQHALACDEVAVLPITGLLEFLTTTRLRACRDIAQQRDWTVEKIREELFLYDSAYELFTNEGGVECVRPRSGDISPKTSSA